MIERSLLQRLITGNTSPLLTPHTLFAIHLSGDRVNHTLIQRLLPLMEGQKPEVDNLRVEIVSHLKLDDEEAILLFSRCAHFLKERSFDAAPYLDLGGIPVAPSSEAPPSLRELFESSQRGEVVDPTRAYAAFKLGCERSDLDLMEQALNHLEEADPSHHLLVMRALRSSRANHQVARIYIQWHRVAVIEPYPFEESDIPLWRLLIQEHPLFSELDLLFRPAEFLLLTWKGEALPEFSDYLVELARSEKYTHYGYQLLKLIDCIGQNHKASPPDVMPAVKALLSTYHPWKLSAALPVLTATPDPARYTLIGRSLFAMPCSLLPLYTSTLLREQENLLLHKAILTGIIEAIPERRATTDHLLHFCHWQARRAGHLSPQLLLEEANVLQREVELENDEALAFMVGLYRLRAATLRAVTGAKLVAVFPPSDRYGEIMQVVNRLDLNKTAPKSSKIRRLALLSLSFQVYAQALETEHLCLSQAKGTSVVDSHINAMEKALYRLDHFCESFGLQGDRLLESLIYGAREAQATLLAASPTRERRLEGRLFLMMRSAATSGPKPLVPYEAVRRRGRLLELSVETLPTHKNETREQLVSAAIEYVIEEPSFDTYPQLALEAVTGSLLSYTHGGGAVDESIVWVLLDAFFTLVDKHSAPHEEVSGRLIQLRKIMVGQGANQAVALLDHRVESLNN